MLLHDTLSPHTPVLERYALSLTKDPSASQDLVQDTFVKMLSRTGPQPDNLQGYLLSVMHNLFVDRTRAVDRKTLPIDDIEPEAPDAPQFLRSTCRETVEAVTALAPDYADVLIRHACHGQSYAEIARELDLPIGTVMSRINRARAALRAALDLDPEVHGAAIWGDT